MSPKTIPGTPEDLHRQFVVGEVLSWIGTPYDLRGRVKGAGCDCFTILTETLRACGLLCDMDNLPIYAGDWWAHLSDEQYAFRLMRFATKTFEGRAYVNNPVKSGNVIVVRAAGTQSRIFNHGAIVIEWPRAVHSVTPRVEEFNVTSHHMWAGQQIAVFDPWVVTV